MRGAVERVVAHEAEREGAPDALVGSGQATDALAQGEQRPRDAAGLDPVGELVADRRARGERREPREERVGPLVAQQERNQLLFAGDEADGQLGEDVFTKDVVRDERGHGPSSSARSFSAVPLG